MANGAIARAMKGTLVSGPLAGDKGLIATEYFDFDIVIHNEITNKKRNNSDFR
jgi:hypothetical protein